MQKPGEEAAERGRGPGRGAIVRFQHKLSHQVPVIARVLVLRNEMGGRIGTAVIFHPAESLDALPHGECSEGSEVEAESDGV